MRLVDVGTTDIDGGTGGIDDLKGASATCLSIKDGARSKRYRRSRYANGRCAESGKRNVRDGHGISSFAFV